MSMCFRAIPRPGKKELELKAKIEATIGTALGQNPDIVKLHQEYNMLRMARHNDYANVILGTLVEPPPEAKSWREDYKGKLED